jgi:predicted DCC family thiol-disulfide oxidoreductase YuxK
MARLDWRARLAWWPSQTPGLIEVVGLTRAEADAAAWTLLPDGTRRQGAPAIASALDQLWPGGVPVCATLVRLPVVGQLAGRVYAWVAANRHRLPGSAACPVGRAPSPAPADVLAEARRRSGAIP